MYHVKINRLLVSDISALSKLNTNVRRKNYSTVIVVLKKGKGPDKKKFEGILLNLGFVTPDVPYKKIIWSINNAVFGIWYILYLGKIFCVKRERD